jgi:hypothetical protein
MATQKIRQKFNDVHKRQLFHWIGGDIDADFRARKLSVQGVREKYLAYLQDDIQHGLAIKPPISPEKLQCNHYDDLELALPVACFTEWALSESQPHSSRYGRMALGFSKPWIIKHGGQPVAYFSHIQKGLFLKNALALHTFLLGLKDVGPCRDGPKPHEIASALEQLRYFLSFAKPFAQPKDKHKSKSKRHVPPRPGGPTTVKRKAVQHVAIRYYGQVLDYLEEREWRIVRQKRSYFVNDPTGRFDSRLRFQPGTELFSLVLPDLHFPRSDWC